MHGQRRWIGRNVARPLARFAGSERLDGLYFGVLREIFGHWQMERATLSIERIAALLRALERTGDIVSIAQEEGRGVDKHATPFFGGHIKAADDRLGERFG